jgi:hypothetical protein
MNLDHLTSNGASLFFSSLCKHSQPFIYSARVRSYTEFRAN